MKAKLYHVCISSTELLFRVERDYVEGINRLVISGFLTNTSLLAYALMSNHLHIIIKSQNVAKFVHSFRTSYNSWFNFKYRRRGRLGAKNYHLTNLDFLSNILDAFSYVLKNGVHHNLVEYPSEYKFSSARYYFMKEFGINHLYSEIESMPMIRKHISYRGDIPTNIKMDISGMFIPESFLAINSVEDYYASVRCFAYHMNKPLAEEWAIINIEGWQKGILSPKIKNKVLHITDLEICTKIDTALMKRNMTYVELSIDERKKIVDLYIRDYGALDTQMERCLYYYTGNVCYPSGIGR